MNLKKKIWLLLNAAFLSSAVFAGVNITVIHSNDVVDFEVLNSNYANLKLGVEDNQAATQSMTIAIGALIVATQQQGVAISALNAATQAQTIAIGALIVATQQQGVAISALNAATNTQQIMITSLISNTQKWNQITAATQSIAQLTSATQALNTAIAQLTILVNALTPPGTIRIWPGTTGTIPDGWWVCEGASYATNDFQALFAVLKTDRLPDLRGRVIVGKSDSGSFATLGNIGGYENVTLTIAQMPSHNHRLNWASIGPDGTTPYYPYVPSTDSRLQAYQEVSVGYKGGGLSHSNMPPYMVLDYIIKY